MSVAENISRVREQIAAAARSCGRDPEEITLVGASKTKPAEACREAIAAGIDALGENRVQELTQKWAKHAYEGAPVHFIGHLQRNKVRQVVGRASLIESADSYELLGEIDRCACKLGIVQDVLIEVNIGGEESKSGVAPGNLDALLERAAGLGHIRIRGLMAVPPAARYPGETVQYFQAMRQLYVDISRKTYDNINVKYLSMGMSGDFQEAIAAGSNMVRIGTAIFGERSRPDNLVGI